MRELEGKLPVQDVHNPVGGTLGPTRSTNGPSSHGPNSGNSTPKMCVRTWAAQDHPREIHEPTEFFAKIPVVTPHSNLHTILTDKSPSVSKVPPTMPSVKTIHLAPGCCTSCSDLH